MTSIKDEENLLSKIIHMETAIRAKREKERLAQTGQSDMLRTIFEPITRELKTLRAIEESTTPTAVTTPVTTAVTPIQESHEWSASTAVDSGGAPSPSSFSVDTTPPHAGAVKKVTTAAAAADTPVGVNGRSPSTPSGLPPSSMYRKALEKVENNNHEDGLTGLSISNGTINGKKYTINAGARALTVNGKTFQIEHPETWILLLAKNPTRYIDLTNPKNNQYYPYVKEYQSIASSINMPQYLRKNYNPQKYQKRKKWELLKNLSSASASSSSSGRGFIFSSKPPPPVRDRFLPSDPQGVLRELRKAIAEYEAGNTGMRQIITPLVAQARRMNILPKKMEKSLREFNWIYT